MKTFLLLGALFTASLPAWAVGDHTLETVATFTFANASPVLSESGTLYWFENAPAGGRINSTAGVYASEPRSTVEVGDWPVYHPSDIQGSSLLTQGRYYIPAVGSGFNGTPALYLNASTRLIYYGTPIPTVTSSDQVQVEGASFDSNGSIVFLAARRAIGSDQFTAVCRATGSSVATLVRSGQTVMPGTSEKFTLVAAPTVSNGTILFYGEAGLRRGVFQLTGGRLSKVVERDSVLPDGTKAFILDASSVGYVNEGTDVVVIFRSSGGSIHKRVKGVWSTVAPARAAIPGGTGNFLTYSDASIHNGQVMFTGGRNNSFLPPVQIGVYQEVAPGQIRPVVDLSDDFSGHVPTYFMATPGGRWWRNGRLAFMAQSSGWAGMIRVTLAPTPLTATADTFILRSTSATTVPVLANDFGEWGAALRVTAVTAPMHGKTKLASGKVTYTPDATFTGADSFSYTMTDGTTEKTAVVTVRNPFLDWTGGFKQVVLGSGGAGVGTLTAQLSAGGAMSGKVIVNGATFTLKGAVDGDGKFTQSFPRSKLAPLTLTLNFLENIAGDAEVSGTITGENPTYTIPPSTTTLTKLPAGVTPGNYTVLFAPDATAARPRGTGWATVTVAKSATAKFSGRLGDNTPFSASGTIRKDQTLAIFTKLYKKPVGSFAGAVTFRAQSGSDFDGTFQWAKPAQTPADLLFPTGFTSTVAAQGALFTKPAAASAHTLAFTAPAAASAQLILRSGDLPDLTLTAPVAANDQFATATNKLSGKLERAKGLFTAQFTPTGATKAVKITGAQQQKLNKAAGVFPGTTTTGSAEFLPQ